MSAVNIDIEALKESLKQKGYKLTPQRRSILDIIIEKEGMHLTVEEIYAIADKYADAARRAQMAGFDAVEIHGGHSYLLCQFLSPLYNKRTDEFGGSLENRVRFPKLVLEKVRAAVGPMFQISFRFSADEFIWEKKLILQ